jgi:hypothetical protein
VLMAGCARPTRRSFSPRIPEINSNNGKENASP